MRFTIEDLDRHRDSVISWSPAEIYYGVPVTEEQRSMLAAVLGAWEMDAYRWRPSDACRLCDTPASTDVGLCDEHRE